MRNQNIIAGLAGLAIAAGLGLTACGSSPAASSAPVASSSVAAASSPGVNLCQAQVGTAVVNTSTGQDTSLTVVSATYVAGSYGSNNAGGNAGDCYLTESDGQSILATATLFANGTSGWYFVANN